ncbi:MAG: OsmC family protein [Chloroflexota bacterium]|nr:OsmC family protein [Lentimicrobium sp.]
MKFTRNASANWKGGTDGKGLVSSQSGVLQNTPYTFKMRFEDEKGTNPEELIGAAHAGCFTMQLAVLIDKAGFKADNLDTTATVTFQDGSITTIKLNLIGSVPGMSAEQFTGLANQAKEICPVSKLLKAAEIQLEQKFV